MSEVNEQRIRNLTRLTPILVKSQSKEGLEIAKTALRRKHRVVQPEISEEDFHKLEADNIYYLTMVKSCDTVLDDKNWAMAMSLSNRVANLASLQERSTKEKKPVHDYGKISFTFHQKFADLLNQIFGEKDRFLVQRGPKCFGKAVELIAKGRMDRATTVYRYIVHRVALNKTLGKKAHDLADPYALIDPEELKK